MNPGLFIAVALALAIALTLAVPNAGAGHGLMNSFADIEWLPDPGRTPADATWALDNARERTELALLDGQERQQAALEYAREKLAEVDAMVRAADAEAARAALEIYAERLDEALEVYQSLPDSVRAEAGQHHGQALLEHQYLAVIEYLDLPREARSALLGAAERAERDYRLVRASLPKRYAEAQFFKEEEVRWVREVARQADEQGL